MNKEEVLAGLLAGRKLMVDRKDAPLLPWLLDQVEAGVLQCERIDHDEQSSALRFSAAKPG